MVQKICALLQKRPETVFALDKAPRIAKPRKSLVEKPVKQPAKRKPK